MKTSWFLISLMGLLQFGLNPVWAGELGELTTVPGDDQAMSDPCLTYNGPEGPIREALAAGPPPAGDDAQKGE